MALPLTAGQNAAGAIPGIVGAVYSYKQAGKKTPQEREAERLAAMSQDYNNMLMNPNDPRYKAMLEAETQGLRGGFLQNLRDMVEANRRQAIMGRQQFFDPERRDESMFSAVNRTGQQAQLQARGNVLDRINQAIQNLQGQQSTAMGLAGLEGARRGAKQQAVLAGLGAVGSGINAFNRQ